jgi:hypothetical protein
VEVALSRILSSLSSEEKSNDWSCLREGLVLRSLSGLLSERTVGFSVWATVVSNLGFLEGVP